LVARGHILRELGHHVDVASTGTEAWEKYQAAITAGTRYTIVIADYRMNDAVDGVELIRRIRAAEIPVPVIPTRIILLSGFTNCLPEEKTGADEVLCKSNNEVPELLRAVTRFATSAPRRRPPGSAPAAPKAKRKTGTE
jgi:CheY-like chemotaxis protein